ncbi:hypothetical protein [Microbacterium indicum]|uniref:hypothetical protein n=1 Tax=Microbacterium indicum TaxID=358100 RepID=UPI000405C3C6|nr:hypothetical protein [Microbacterium indicum]
MQFASALVTVAEGHGAVMAETLAYPIVAVAVFAVLGIVVASYRHVANRHADPAANDAHKH